MAKQICPFLSSGRKKVKCVEHDCMMWTHIIGTNPQSGAAMDHWGCAIAWMPTLILEVAHQGRKTQGAVESFRNQMHLSVLAIQRGIEIPALSGNLEKDMALIRQFEAGGAARQLAAELQDGKKGEGPPGR